MSRSSDDAEARLEALLRANDEATAEEAQTEAAFLTQETIGFYPASSFPSEEEKQLQALLAANEPGSLSEDLVPLSLPGLDRGAPSASPGGSARSPMLSSSLSSGGPRGGAFLPTVGKKFSVVKILKGDSVCLSDIGDGATFCLRIGCKIVSHSTVGAQSFKLDDEGVIAIAKSRDAAFAMPVLGGASLPQSVWDEWSDASRTLSTWNQVFKAAKQDENFSSGSEFEARLREHQLSDHFKTPAKKKGKSGGFLVSAMQDLSIYPLSVTTVKKESFRKANPGRMTDIVLGLDEALHSLSQGVGAIVKETQDSVSELEMTTTMLELKAGASEGLLGSISLMRGSSFQSPTVFGTMAALASKLEVMDLAGPPSVDFSPIQAEIEQAKAESKRLLNLSISLISALSDKVGGLQRRAKLPPLETSSGNPGFPTPPPWPRQVPQSGVPSPTIDLSEILARISSLETQQATQGLELQRLVSEGDETAVKFGGLGLKSLEETGAWIDIHTAGGPLPFSVIPCCYFILDIVAADGVTSQTQMLQTFNRLKNLGLSSEYEAKAIAAFLLEVPRFFHGPSESGSFASGAGESQLSMVPTFKAWSQGQGSRKKLLERKLPGIRASMRVLIRDTLQGSNPRVYSLAIEALDRSISWITSLASWIDRSYEYAHISSKFSEAKSWSLVTQLVRRVFAEIYVVRMGTTQAMSGDRRSICSSVLWSVFRTHDKMTEFEDQNFEDHPAISSEYIKFMATNSGFDMIASLEKDVSSLKAEVKEADRRLTTCTKKADSASTTADTNRKSIGELIKRVDKKADK